MEDKVALTLACLNIKKLVKMIAGKTYNYTQISQYYWIIGELGKNIKKTNIKNDVCLHSQKIKIDFLFYYKIDCSFKNLKNAGYSFFRLTKLPSFDKKLCSERPVQTRTPS